jgi:hypothetical protein
MRVLLNGKFVNHRPKPFGKADSAVVRDRTVDNLLLNAAIEVAAALTRILLNNPRFPKLFRGLKCPGCLARESSGEPSRQQIGLRDGCQWLGQAPRGPSCHRPMAYLLHADTAPRHESP